MDDKRFKEFTQKTITTMFDNMLTYVEVAVPNKWVYEKIRSRILTEGNNAIRNIFKECDNYNIKYEPKEVVEMEILIDREEKE